jgi:hypothetical protein
LKSDRRELGMHITKRFIHCPHETVSTLGAKTRTLKGLQPILLLCPACHAAEKAAKAKAAA